MDKSSFPTTIVVAALIALVLAVALVLIFVGRQDDIETPVDQTVNQTTEISTEQQSQPEPAENQQPKTEPILPTESESESTTETLPDNWGQLGRQGRLDLWNELNVEEQANLWQNLAPRQKTALNPLDCPTDEDDIVRLSAETGECLGDVEDDENAEVEPTAVVPDDASFVGLGEAFMYSADSEVTVTGLSCVNLEFFTLPISSDLTLGQILSEKADEYARYKADSYALLNEYFEKNLNFAYLEYYAYLNSFEEYLAVEGSAVDGDLAEQLIEYLICDVSVTLKNIGEDSTFSDGCGLRFDKPVSLVGQEMIYGELYRNRLYDGIACTQARVDFPTGATDSDVVSFIVSSKYQITEILVQNPDNAFRVVLDIY